MTAPSVALPAFEPPSFEEVRAAAARIAGHAHRTPVLTSATLDRMAGASVRLKCECFQRVGAFKFRGAMNTVASLTDAVAASGVATHSSGNHAQAVALAARIRGIPAHIVMPSSAPRVKRAAVEGYGARIVMCEPTLAARERTLADVVRETGATPIHPYDDARVIAGQGTAALELLEDTAEPLDVVLVPVGGGGLIAGTLLSVEALSPGTQVIGVEPAAADDARRSLLAGEILPAGDPVTIADGLRTSLGRISFALLQRARTTILTVSEDEIRAATRFVLERMKIVVEPSGAVPIAALLAGRVKDAARVGVIVSGGNIDFDALFSIPAPSAP